MKLYDVTETSVGNYKWNSNAIIIMQLYIEPVKILNLYETRVWIPISTALEPDSRVPSESKINGRLTFPDIQVTQLDAVAEESTGDTNQQCNKTQEVSHRSERRSDEKIIAEILKPEERIRLSKSSDRLLKISGTNTAISLD